MSKQTTQNEHDAGRVDVLLVEDSPTDALLLRESLRDYPLQQFEIEHVQRAEEAVARLALRPFDVILLDLDLPDSRGIQTAERLARAAAHVPIIILTGADDEHLAAEAMRLGIQDYLVKEHSRGHVVGRAVRYAVERRRSQQALQEANARLQEQKEELQVQAEELQAQAEELRASNEALRASEARARAGADELQAIMDVMPAITFIAHDREARQMTSSRATYELLRLPSDANTSQSAPAEQRPHTFRALQDGRELKPEELPVQRAAATGREVRDCELTLTFEDGTARDILGGATPLLDEQGRSRGAVGAFIDITDRKQMEATLRELNATLEIRVAARTAELKHRARQLQRLTLEMSEAEERERKRLAEILHDDLQQQLAGAKFHLGLLSTRLKGNASLREAAAEVTGMLQDAIEKTRSLSHELSPALLYHGDFGAALETLASQIQAKHGLIVHVEVRGRAEISSDPIRAFLFRTAQEILFNTVKHAQVAEATVRLQRRHGRLWLTVSDRGRGFDSRTLGQTAGFGLLSIRERVELLGGRMKIRSVPGRGSTFLIAVPDGESASPAQQGAHERLRVLLVDDHEVVREGLALLLSEQEDIEVVGQAGNGLEAVDLTHQLRPDVVVMDVAMPLMRGDEATRQIKQDMPGTRVVGLSMFEEPEAAEKMHEAGAERYMLKTAPAEELLAAIRDR